MKDIIELIENPNLIDQVFDFLEKSILIYYENFYAENKSNKTNEISFIESKLFKQKNKPNEARVWREAINKEKFDDNLLDLMHDYGIIFMKGSKIMISDLGMMLLKSKAEKVISFPDEIKNNLIRIFTSNLNEDGIKRLKNTSLQPLQLKELFFVLLLFINGNGNLKSEKKNTRALYLPKNITREQNKDILKYSFTIISDLFNKFMQNVTGKEYTETDIQITLIKRTDPLNKHSFYNKEMNRYWLSWDLSNNDEIENALRTLKDLTIELIMSKLSRFNVQRLLEAIKNLYLDFKNQYIKLEMRGLSFHTIEIEIGFKNYIRELEDWINKRNNKTSH